MQNRLYCDNSATSFPKPPEVLQAMVDYATRIGASSGRGAYAEAQASTATLKTCRQRLNTLFNGANPDHFIFTLNCTDALNLAIQGIIRQSLLRGESPHAITTWMDHNSVLRPYHHLAAESKDFTFSEIPVDPASCRVDPDDIRRAIRPNTKLISVVHASNVTGSLQPIRDIGKIARDHGIPFLVDGAQSAGHVPIDLQADHIDLLAFPGHKGLLGPLGTGALYIRPGLEKQLRPLRFGGTGSVSEVSSQPEVLPDKFESGSHNAIGIAGLSAGIAWIQKRTVQTIFNHDQLLCKIFLDNLAGLDALQILGLPTPENRIGVFSVRIESLSPHQLAKQLESDFGILSRAGLHCAPLAHTTLKTIHDPVPGTTRLSFGPFLKESDIQYITNSLTQIAKLVSKKPPLEHAAGASLHH
jgi:cysteine desulfurase family protein